MSNILKIVISFIILIIIISLLSFLIFYSNIDIGVVNFINAKLETKYSDNINKIGRIVEKYFVNKEFEINNLLDSLDFSKFIDKSKSKQINIGSEMKNIDKYKLKEPFFNSIKIINEEKTLVFSSNSAEQRLSKTLVSFISADGIEKNPVLFAQNNPLNFINDKKNNYLIIYKNFKYQSINFAVLFYYTESALFNYLLNSEAAFRSVSFINNEKIIIDKPNEISSDYLDRKFDILPDESKSFIVEFTDDFGTKTKITYKPYSYEVKNYNLTVFSLVESSALNVDKQKSIVLFFIFFITLYLLILILLSLRKTEFEKAKEKISLFSAVLLEEMINAKSKSDIEKIKSNLNHKKDILLQTIYKDFKKLNKNNKKDIEDQLDIILDKIDQTIEKNMESIQQAETIQKIEKIFEKFIQTLTEKGIPLNYNNLIQIPQDPDKIRKKSAGIDKSQPIEVEEVEQLEDAGDVEDLSDADEIEEIDEVEELEDAEDVEELSDADEIEEIDEVEELEDAETVEELGDADEIEEIDEVEELEDAETVEELGDADEIEKIDEVEELEDEELVVVENIEKVEEAEELDNKDNKIENITQDEDIISKNRFLIENGMTDGEIAYDENYYESLNEFPEITQTNVDDDETPDIDDNVENIETLEEFDELEDLEPENVREIETIDDLFKIDDDEIRDNEDSDEIEEIEGIDSDDEINEVPKIPDEFYEGSENIDGELPSDVTDSAKTKTPFQTLLDEVADQTDAKKLSLLISLNNKSFIQTYQVGFNEKMVEKYNLDENNILVQHIFTKERLVFISDMKKLEYFFENNQLTNEYENMSSLLIYPIKIFGKIRSLLFLSFLSNKKENLENIIETLENNKDALNKNILKLI
ncbi:MAG: hypothetical protein KA885_13225 [Spirochaetes bacterium]|nr:hypothetical protein [Spirochaetota bacterium]